MREHGEAVLLTFAVSDRNLVPFHVYIFDAQAQAFYEPEAGAVEEGGQEQRRSIHLAQERLDFGVGKDDGEPFGASGGGDSFKRRQGDAQYLSVEEQKRISGNILGGGGDMLLDGEMGKIVSDGFGSEQGRVSFAVEYDEASDRGEVAVFGVNAEMFDANDGADMF